MRIASLSCMLALLVLSTTIAFAGINDIVQWGSYDFDTKPYSPDYASGTVTLSGTELQVNSNAGSKQYWILPYDTWLTGVAYQEKLGLAKFVWPEANAGQKLSGFRVKVYDPGSAAGWSIIIKNASGAIFDFGIRPFYKTGTVIGNVYDGTAWNGDKASILQRAKTGEYFDMTFSALADGKITVATTYNGSVISQVGTTSWTTPVAFGDIEDIYLASATSTTTYTNMRYQLFEPTFTPVPEPSSFAALLAGLPVIGFAVRRRK